MTRPRRRSRFGVNMTPAGKLDRTYKGDLYASKAEMRRAVTLDVYQAAGLITSWRRQVGYKLIVNGALIKRCFVDFEVVAQDGSLHCEDVKGRDTEASKLTHKLWDALYPDIEYRILWAKDI